MNVWLKPFSPLDGEREWKFLQDMGADEQGFTNDCFGKSLEEFPDYIQRHLEFSNSIGLEKHHVPQSAYWVMLDEQIVGVGKIRHRLNESLLQYGGHIGYGLHAEYRGKGIGKKMLTLLLDRARRKGIDSVLITCHPANLASQKIIEANGGILGKKSEEVYWYWVTD